MTQKVSCATDKILQSPKIIYLIGIGGIGMSALARYFISKNLIVMGSDSNGSSITRSLLNEGVKVKIGQNAANLPKGRNRPDLVIYNRAIQPDNPELKAARALGLRVVSYAEVLGEITEEYETIAITGSHGKTTTTALASLLLMKAGFDPTILIGTNMKELGNTNFRAGGAFRNKSLKNNSARKDFLVLEADDYGAAFTHYSPFIAVVTNIDREHLDFYKNFRSLKLAFIKFLSNVRSGGYMVLNRDDSNLWSLRQAVSRIAAEKGIRIVWYSIAKSKSRKAQPPSDADKISRVIKIPGAHNLSNAAAVLEVAHILKIQDKQSLGAIGSYRGSWRRMEFKGNFRGAQVFDDYAHHPTEIKATLKAFHEKFGEKKIVCVFQPHLAKRLQGLFKEFAAAFQDADKVIILPVYKVAGRHIDPEGRYDSEALARAVKKKMPDKSDNIEYLADSRDLKSALIKLSMDDNMRGWIIVMMGAGDIVDLTSKIVLESIHVRGVSRYR